MIEGLDLFADFLHNLAAVPEEPLQGGLRLPNLACVRSVYECKYHIMHSWDDQLLGFIFVAAVWIAGHLVGKMIDKVKGIFSCR